MRLSTFASMVLAPVLLAVIAGTAHAAPPAKQIAKRPSYKVLPAPTTTSSSALPVLPALPAPAADPNAVTKLTSAPSPRTTSAVATPVSATADRGDTLSAPAEATSPPSPSAAAHKPVAEAPAPQKNYGPNPSGVVLDFGVGVLAPTTSFYSGGDILLPGAAVHARVGYYFARHVGLVAGFRGSYGHTTADCDDSCNGYSLQVPVVVQLALDDRTRGLYGELGVGLGTTFAVFDKKTTIGVSSPVELKVGAGYRFTGAYDPRRTMMLDVNLGMDVGRMTSADLRSGGAHIEGSIDAPTTHVVLALSAVSHFSL